MSLVFRAGAVLCGAIGAWAALGAVALAPGPTAASRVAILPPFWLLAALAAALAALVFGARLSAARVRPLYAALLLLLPLLPLDVPAVWLTWQGVPAAMLLAGISVAMVAAEPVAWPETARAWFGAPARAAWLASVLAACVFAFAWKGTANWLPAGDEPHYLVIAQSLLRDFDLRIDDNHQRRDYLEYFNGELKPDFLKRGKDGHVYSVHAPGLPAVIAPAYAVGGYRASAIFLLIVCALGTGLLWRLGWQTTGDVGAAWFGWATVTLAVPIVAHAYTIYPDGLSSVLLLCATWGLLSAAIAPLSSLALVGLAAAMLPWLHTRNAVIAGLVGLAMVARLASRVDRVRAIAAYAAAPLVSAAAWFASFYAIYGTFSPAAPYGGYANSKLEYLLPGVPGLFFDQQYGFLATAPGFVAGLAGLVMALAARGRGAGEAEGVAQRRRLAAELLVVFACYLVAVASYRMWWGGASAPARFLVPVLMPLGVAAAWTWRAATRPANRAALLVLVTLSGVLCVAFTWGGDGMVAFTTRALYGPLYEWMTRAVDLSSGLPSSFRAAPGVVASVAAVWMVSAVVAWTALRMLAHSRAGAAAVAPWAAAVAVMVGLWGGWTVTASPPLRVDSSRLSALLEVSPRAHAWLIGAPELRPGVRGPLVVAPSALPLLQIQQVARGPVPKNLIASAAPLRAGTYRIVLSPALPEDAVVTIGIGRSGPVISRRVGDVPRDADQRRTFRVDLPVEVNALTVSTQAQVSGASAWIEPLSLEEGAGRFAGGRAATAERYGELIAYFVTDRQFPEPNGLWLRPDGESVVVVQPDAPRGEVTALLRNGPFDNVIEVRTGAGTERIELRPGEERPLRMPIENGAGAVAVGFRVARWFRPSEVDPKSDDVRRLGAWLEFR